VAESIVAVSRRFFQQVVLPILEREFPEAASQAAFGIFGLGSEAYGLDDALSRDHHWGLRIDAVLPDALYLRDEGRLRTELPGYLPHEFEGQSLREGHVAGAGLAPESLPAFLRRSVGLVDVPASDEEWLQLPEEDVIHILNGELWHDPSGEFTRIRAGYAAYYPDAVWRRRIAHWCRYYSGMGVYALQRALLRQNELYAATAFGKAIRWGVQLAFLLDRTYFPYDKWLWSAFTRLPRLYEPLGPLVEEAVRGATGWERKLELLNAISEVLDRALVADGLIRAHPQFRGSPTSGYRLLEHAYAELSRPCRSACRQWSRCGIRSTWSNSTPGTSAGWIRTAGTTCFAWSRSARKDRRSPRVDTGTLSAPYLVARRGPQ